MAMAAQWAMHISTLAADRLALVQMLSPAFPVGGYAYSQGLEQAMVDGTVQDAASLTDWITALITHGSGWMDAVLLAQARTGDVGALADLAYAYAPSAERSAEMRDQGATFGQLVARLTGVTPPELPYALAVGHATQTMALDSQEVLALWLQAFAAQLVSAAVRFIPLGGAEGQAVLLSLSPVILQTASRAAEATLDDLFSSSIGADMAAMRHETLEVRIFRS
ncbi:urease accessory protein UreF [Pseudorhodobacter aquimaris]|uniref:urease accessory protein UreF n=1 Tax=Pseudorhodobacter aquimaris TaxID=687412 RepID=UPI0009F90C39|nr:urease accessory UreF family protein [Pseudorhodobacter aquimaris]